MARRGMAALVTKLILPKDCRKSLFFLFKSSKLLINIHLKWGGRRGLNPSLCFPLSVTVGLTFCFNTN